MERVWRWTWRRYRDRYSWAVYALSATAFVPLFVLGSVIVVWLEHEDEFLAAVGLGSLTAFGVTAASVRPGSRLWKPLDRWVAGDESARRAALEATYSYGRSSVRLVAISWSVGAAANQGVVAAMCGAGTGKVVQYAAYGACIATSTQLIGTHTFVDASMRPPRMALTTLASGIGEDLPRAQPSFATWSITAVLATAWGFSAVGASLATIVGELDRTPLLIAGLATAITIGLAVPVTVTTAFSPSLQPLRDLAAATDRVAAGDYLTPLPVVQDDDLGTLAASFNRMQAGLEERRRLASAFGSYVDPSLAARLLDQGDDIFSGERVEVTVMFIDVRDFTPFAEANSAEDTVGHLNALFDIIVPEVLSSGGHVNKYLGDGAMAVFGAPQRLDNHADAAIAAAERILDRVYERFEGAVRIGIGINTGGVIAGTIGGGGKLEFTLIGDAVNVAARVEQATKVTGDSMLFTSQTLDAASTVAPDLLADRGEHTMKGKAAPVRLFALRPTRPDVPNAE